MSTHTLPMTPELETYLRSVSLREPEILAELRQRTLPLKGAQMQIAPEQGQLMGLLVRLIGAKRMIEVGTFTGYSALVMALHLPDDGQLITCDIDEQTTAIAREFWARAGIGHKIELRLGPAVDSLDNLIAAGESGRYDLAFIDADKDNYPAYYERALQLLRPGGLIIIDNTLWGGSVIDPEQQDVDTQAIRAFNRALHEDERVQISLLPMADGITLALKQ